METIRLNQNLSIKKKDALQKDIITFYESTTEDYSFWSKDLNMHFGYFILGKSNPFKRNTMLNEMNNQIYKRLQLPNTKALVADLGCGMGGTIRHFLEKNRYLNIIGVTLSPFQVQEGNKLLVNKKGIILEENYEHTSLKSNSLDRCVGIESLCHSGHSSTVLKEAYRILKPESSFVIGDAFLKKSPDQLCFGSFYSYKKLCKGWSLDGLGVISKVEDTLKNIGFSKITIEDVSFRVAPSVLHVPFAIVGYLLTSMLKRKKVKKQSWNNLKASFYTLLSGLHMNDFGYFIITATK